MDTPAPAFSRISGLGAAIIGAVLFSAVFWATSEGGPAPVQWPEFFSSPVHLTVLFVLPLGLYLMRAGRLKTAGLIWLIAAMTVVHWAAMTVAINVATDNDQGHNGGLMGGAAGGAIGAAGSWAMLMVMGPAFRSGRALSTMLISTAILAALGAYGIGVGSIPNLIALLTGKDYVMPELDPPSLVLSLYLPWQIVYGGTLAQLFEAHRPR